MALFATSHVAAQPQRRSHPTRLIRSGAIATVAAMASGTLVSVAAATPASAHLTAVQLVQSAKADRSSPVPLDGRTLAGRTFVFTADVPGVKTVAFTLDGKAVRTEAYTPFDMHGSSTTSPFPATGWDTRTVANGSHVVGATLVYTDGHSQLLKATVKVANVTTAPAPAPVPAPAPGTFPTASTTGVPAGTVLTPSGGMTITVPGTVVSGKDIRGPLVIRASNVTVRSSRITSSSAWAIDVQGGATNVLIEDVEVNGEAGCEAGIAFDGFTARRVDIQGCKDGVKMRRAARLEQSFVHDLYRSATSHNDGIQVGDGGNIAIIGNNIQHPSDQTSTILIKADFSPIDNVLIEGNLLNGGNYTVYVRNMPGNAVTNVTIRNNTIGRQYVYGVKSINVPVTWTGNVWQDTRATVS